MVVPLSLVRIFYVLVNAEEPKRGYKKTPIIKYDELGWRKTHLFPAVQIFVFCHAGIQIRQIQKHPKRQVGTVSRLVLIQRQPRIDHKRQIILDRHVDRVLQSIDLQQGWILISNSTFALSILYKTLVYISRTFSL